MAGKFTASAEETRKAAKGQFLYFRHTGDLLCCDHWRIQGEAPGTRPSVKSLSSSCSFRGKMAKIIDWFPPRMWGWHSRLRKSWIHHWWSILKYGCDVHLHTFRISWTTLLISCYCLQRMKRQARKLAKIQEELQRGGSRAHTEDQRQLLEVILSEIREQQVGGRRFNRTITIMNPSISDEALSCYSVFVFGQCKERLKIHLHWAFKANVKAIFFLWSLSLLKMSIKLDLLWTHLEAMSLLLLL